MFAAFNNAVEYYDVRGDAQNVFKHPQCRLRRVAFYFFLRFCSMEGGWGGGSC